MTTSHWEDGLAVPRPDTSMQYFLDQQSELQRKMPSPHPTDLFLNAFDDAGSEGFEDVPPGDAEREELIKFLQWNNKAIIHEIVEEEAETGWKPWAKSRHANLEAMKGEWIDQLHFFLNKALAMGMDGEEIRKRYDAKHKKNEQRQAEGYDGVSTKCPGCGRALDDEAVKCKITGVFWASNAQVITCVVDGKEYSRPIQAKS